MLLPPEAFVHVPALAGQHSRSREILLPAAADRLAELDRIARENGYPENWRLTDEAREATRITSLAGRRHRPVGFRLRLADVGPCRSHRRDPHRDAATATTGASA